METVLSFPAPSAFSLATADYDPCHRFPQVRCMGEGALLDSESPRSKSGNKKPGGAAGPRRPRRRSGSRKVCRGSLGGCIRDGPRKREGGRIRVHLRHFREPVLLSILLHPPHHAAVALQIFCKAAVRLGSVVAAAATAAAKTRARTTAAAAALAAAAGSATAKFHFDSEFFEMVFNYKWRTEQRLLKTRIRNRDAFTRLESSTKGR